MNRTYFKKVLHHFKGDKYKNQLWWSTKNPFLGNLSPNNMLVIGREKKLEEFIDNSIDSNKQ